MNVVSGLLKYLFLDRCNNNIEQTYGYVCEKVNVYGAVIIYRGHLMYLNRLWISYNSFYTLKVRQKSTSYFIGTYFEVNIKVGKIFLELVPHLELYD